MVFSLLVIIIFGFVIGMFVVTFLRIATETRQNNASPRLEVEALITGKRTNSTHHSDPNNLAMSHTDTTYFVTFQVASGDRMEFHVRGQEYGMMAEGDRGILRFQGTRFLEFERKF